MRILSRSFTSLGKLRYVSKKLHLHTWVLTSWNLPLSTRTSDVKTMGDPHRYIGVLMHEHGFRKYSLTSLSFRWESAPNTDFALFHIKFDPPKHARCLRLISRENQCFQIAQWGRCITHSTAKNYPFSHVCCHACVRPFYLSAPTAPCHKNPYEYWEWNLHLPAMHTVMYRCPLSYAIRK